MLTDAGPVAADAVVVAAGPWIADLVRVPVKAGRGWLLQAERLDVPWIVEEVSWPDQVVLGRAAEPTPIADVAAGHVDVPVGECALLCPLPGGDGLLGASLSTSLRDAVEGVDVPRRIAARVLEVAPGLRTRIVRAWWGLRPMTPDGLPVAGSGRTGCGSTAGTARSACRPRPPRPPGWPRRCTGGVPADLRGTATGAIHMISQRVQSMLRMTMADVADAADSLDGAFRLENADTCLTPPEHVLQATREAVGVDDCNSYLPLRGLRVLRDGDRRPVCARLGRVVRPRGRDRRLVRGGRVAA